MQAIDDSLTHFLNKSQQFTIPIFQRNYDWDKKQCKQLFDDIIMIGKSSDEAHFLGSIVHLDDKHNIIPTYRVIDGQQRLTTITLLISALAKFLNQNPDLDIGISAKQLVNYYLINVTEEGDLKYKIKLNNYDNKTLHKVIDYTLTEQDTIISSPNDSKKVWDNYRYFLNRIEQEEDVKIVFEGFKKLSIIVVSLKEHLDNPQLIFESLNSKGLPLRNSDLIRNYVLMGLTPNEQDKIYEDYWFEMEQLLENIKGYNFDRFIKDYLTVRENRIPVEKELYNEFKRYAQDFFLKNSSTDKFENIKALTKDIYECFKYFEKFYAGEEENTELRLAFESVNELGYKVITPLFLNLYDDYYKGLLSLSEFLEIINITESYLFRRYVCDLPTHSLKTIFAGAYEQLDKDHYSDSYSIVLLNEEGNLRFPTTREFSRDFVSLNLYRKSSLVKYALRKLENFGHEKEPTPTENYTIEHIMPQNPDLSDEWQAELGYNWREIHEKYLHTIGNLTLTGYNQKYSDLPFKTKRDMENGFRDSSIRLNKTLAELNSWNQNQIEKRANDLKKDAQKIWYYPKVQKHLK